MQYTNNLSGLFQPLNEAALVLALQAQNTAAFTYLYNNYAAALYGVIFRSLKDKEAAEDALQEIFLKIWCSIGQYDTEKGRLFTWMMRICRNFTIDIIRSKRFRKNSVTYAALDENMTSVFNEHAGDTIGLSKAFLKLPEQQRAFLHLAYFEGFSQADIAAIFYMPLGTVKSKIRAAIGQLKKMMLEPVMQLAN